MARSVESRLRELENAVADAIGANERRAYSHTQLVRLGQYKAKHPEERLTPERYAELVGEPEAVLKPGELSHREILNQMLNELELRRAGARVAAEGC